MNRYLNWEFIECDTGDYIYDTDSNRKLFDIIKYIGFIKIIPHKLFSEPIFINSINDIKCIYQDDNDLCMIYLSRDCKLRLYRFL